MPGQNQNLDDTPNLLYIDGTVAPLEIQRAIGETLWTPLRYFAERWIWIQSASSQLLGQRRLSNSVSRTLME